MLQLYAKVSSTKAAKPLPVQSSTYENYHVPPLPAILYWYLHKPTGSTGWGIRQQTDESPVAYLECLKAFQQYTLYDLQTKEYTLIHQVAPDIRKNLQSLERLEEKNIED